jgi:cytochrome c peroxidase
MILKFGTFKEIPMNVKSILGKLILCSILLLFSNCTILETLGLKKEKSDSNDLVLILAGIASMNKGYDWDLPPGFPVPKVPSDNPMSQAKVDLGRHLFYEVKLSQNEAMSCASCHFQNLAFADGKDLPSGITGMVHPRNAQHLSNVAYNTRLTWSNPNMITLEVQARGPMFGIAPIELGLSNNNYLEKLKAIPNYVTLFNNAFGGGAEGVTEQNTRYALASFQRSMISGRSPYDKYINGDKTAISASAARGLNFFNGEVAECFHCHGGFNFTDTSRHSTQSVEEFAYHNNGTMTQAEYDALASEKQGLKDVTGLQSDQGKFKAPSLRNIGVTYPYMHAGNIMCADANNPNKTAGKTIEDCARDALGKVVDQYVAGGKATIHPNVDTSLIRPFAIQPQEKTDLINFLLTLTDSEFLSNPKFSKP